ncbi:transcription factor PIF3-like [Hibiscus syriacus]|uniref:Transcription factor PIF3-like n=1 Tax=Hibiscus syriacus TaxID=106335 RepID=A0A6A3D5H8_HIBSY|nr:transcription factor PIF3-like [Hibiscus syriacus]
MFGAQDMCMPVRKTILSGWLLRLVLTEELFIANFHATRVSDIITMQAEKQGRHPVGESKLKMYALSSVYEIRSAGIFPNHFTFSSVLPACAGSSVLLHGQQMYCLISKHGYEGYVFVGSALVDMYAKCHDMHMAEKETVHGVVVKQGLLTMSYVKNSLMDMYFKCGLFDEGALLFNSIGIEGRDVIPWNVMLIGCVYNENFEEACNYLWVMKRTVLSPDEALYSTALHASTHLAALDQGTLIHNQIIKSGFSTNTFIASSLITMYAKCGSLDDSCRVFEETENRNLVCWTALIAACRQHGNGNHAMELFEKMLANGFKPNYITFVCVLSCGHTGRIEEGHAYFNSMEKMHGIIPGHEHYACMVDLLGRSGQLDEARRFIAQMPIKPNVSVWGALLGACANYGNLGMGIEVSGRLFELEPNNPGNYVLLSNMYAQKGKLKEADLVRRSMAFNRVRKEPGCIWIVVKNKTFVFTVHDKSHAKTDESYEMLKKVE